MRLRSWCFNFFLRVKDLVVKDKSIIFLIFLYTIALGVRLSTWEIVSGDMDGALLPWYDYISNNGVINSFSDNFYNYPPSYLYFISIMTLVRFIPRVMAIKLISIIFDFLAAYFVFKIVKLKYTQRLIPHIASVVFLFAPTIFFNSAVWGQCDIIYTAGILAVVYFCSTEKYLLAFIAFGLAISFKLQAAFIAPFLLLLFLKGKVRWWLFFLVPIIFILSLIPAWAAGRPFEELFLIYLRQANTYHNITLNAPNLYQWLDNTYYSIFVRMGLLLTTGLVVLGLYAVLESKMHINRDVIVILSTISVLAIPFFLPKMHERYFFPADVLSIVYAFYFPKYYYVPIIVGLTSFMTYVSFLFGKSIISFALLPFAMLGMIIIVVHHLWKLNIDGEPVTIE